MSSLLEEVRDPWQIGLSPRDQYAWYRVNEQLMADGCFEFARFTTWGFRQRSLQRSPLLAMSVTEARETERYGTEFVAREIPRLREKLGCN